MANTLDTFTEATVIGDTDLLHVKSGTGVDSDKKITGANAKIALASTPEGISVKSTGETGGTKFLREDGDDTCSWQSVPSGASLSVANEWTKTQNFNATTLSDGASIAWDLESNQVCSVTLAGNRALANPTNLVDGATYILIVKQDATGSRTLSYGTAYRSTNV